MSFAEARLAYGLAPFYTKHEVTVPGEGVLDYGSGRFGGGSADAGPDLSPLATCSPCLSRIHLCAWKLWWRGAVVIGLGAVRTRGGEGVPPTTYEPQGPSLDPYKRKSHK